MSEIVYEPGEWQVVVEESGVVAVPSDAAPETLVALTQMLQHGAPALTEVIDALSGGSIAALGSFAVALRGAEGTRFAVRGRTVEVRVADASGVNAFSGADVSTWSERFVAGAVGFEMSLGEPTMSARYAIRSGVVLAASVRAGEIAEPVVEPVTDSEPGSEPVVQQPGSELVDEVPSLHTLIPTEFTYAPEPAVEPEPAAEPEPAPEAPLPSDAALDQTVAAVPASVPTPTGADALGDHDGATISLAEARRLRAQAPASDPEAPTEILPTSDAPAQASAGRIRLSSGQVLDLDRTVIIGRRPRSTRASGETLPHLVAVESPQQDISRNHLEIRPEGDSVVVIDLHTTNGSTLLRPGADPVRLHPGEQTLVLDGDTVDLGDGVTVGFEGLA